MFFRLFYEVLTILSLYYNMSLHTVEKQCLLKEKYSKDALRLAHAIYNTHFTNDQDLYLNIKLERVLSLFKISNNPQSIAYIIELFEELNEPLGVKNFEFRNRKYKLRFITFCKYKIKDGWIIIELCEEFLHAEKVYMKDKFLTN
jgi:hypothetical protein